MPAADPEIEPERAAGFGAGGATTNVRSSSGLAAGGGIGLGDGGGAGRTAAGELGSAGTDSRDVR